MKIRYKKRQLLLYPIVGVIWLALTIFWMFYDPFNFLTIAYLVLALVYFGMFALLYFRQYLTIENGVLTKNSIIPKSLVLSEVTEIERCPEEIILKTKDATLKINTLFIDPKSQEDLLRILGKVEQSID